MTMNEIIRQLLKGLIALPVVISVAAAVVAIWHHRRVIRIQHAAYNARALFDIVVHEYLDRQFSATRAPADLDFANLREAKRMALKELEDDPLSWSQDVQNEGGWRNRVAFELSVALERLGVAVATGVVPLRFLLPLAAGQILDDWRICKPWVDFHRDNEPVFESRTAIPFQRRHAEWLALLCAVWMTRIYTGCKPLSAFQRVYGTGREIAAIFRYRCQQERAIIDPSVRRDIRKLTGTNWFRWDPAQSKSILTMRKRS
jgi:hypothetical protein